MEQWLGIVLSCLTIIGTVLGMGYATISFFRKEFIRFDIEMQIQRDRTDKLYEYTHELIKQQAERTDSLYNMFYELVKNQGNKK
jgi:hypothetical protein